MPPKKIKIKKSKAKDKLPGRAPIDRLPVELLAVIFVLGSYTEKSGVGEDVAVPVSPCFFYPQNFPRGICVVCKHWRAVAISTPELWSKVWISVLDAGDGTIWPGALTDGFSGTRTSLARSASYPLHVCLDARDPQWNSSEFDDSTAGQTPNSDYEENETYVHPFSHLQVRTAMSLLKPHLHRILTFAILTDRWLPMYEALRSLSFHNATRDAPMLESLALIRCNPYARVVNLFDPPHFKEPFFLPFGSGSNIEDGYNPSVFPCLKNLNLNGVHVQWSLLPRLMPSSLDGAGLQTLELSHHCNEVRPSADDFRALLERCPRLQCLTVDMSGPAYDFDEEDRLIGYDRTDSTIPVPLPYLTTLNLGWSSDCWEVIDIIHMLQATNVHTVSLQEGFRDYDDEHDTGSLLIYLASGSTNGPSSASAKLHPVFPRLETLSMHNVRAVSQESFEVFFASASSTRDLSLTHVSPCAHAALKPRTVPGDDGSPPIIPCPAMRKLRIRGFCGVSDTFFETLLVQRHKAGAPPPADVHLDAKVSMFDIPEALLSTELDGADVPEQIYHGALLSPIHSADEWYDI